MTILQGLRLIERYGLPHPEWQFVRYSAELKIGHIRDYVGWTIRTAALIDSKKKWTNVFVNWVSKRDVPVKLDELQSQQRGEAIFVVYPSWKWKKAGAVMSEGMRVTVEGVNGSIGDLSRKGRMHAQFVYHRHQLNHTHGDQTFFTPSEKKIIQSACERFAGKDIIAEFAVTTRNKLVFYRLERVEEAVKLLIKKYS
ncbi:MAG: hypothetical protein WC659_06410 [Patescibacteria group bacterium]